MERSCHWLLQLCSELLWVNLVNACIMAVDGLTHRSSAAFVLTMIYNFEWKQHANVSLCTGNRANANCKWIASWVDAWFLNLIIRSLSYTEKDFNCLWLFSIEEEYKMHIHISSKQFSRQRTSVTGVRECFHLDLAIKSSHCDNLSGSVMELHPFCSIWSVYLKKKNSLRLVSEWLHGRQL